MGFHYFVLGFVSAFVFLGALVIVGGKKGHEYIQQRLEELKEEQAKNPKKLEALKLEPVKQVATVKMEIMAAGRSSHSIKAKLSLTGTKLKIHVIEEKTKENPEGGVAEKPVAILTTTAIACKMENRTDPPPRTLHLTSNDPSVHPLFKDERDGQTDWLRADVKFDTVRECERWYNVLHANERTLEWKSHVKALPSVDVFNVFLGRILFNLNNDPEFEQLIHSKITKKLQSVKLPLAGTLKLNTLSVGKQIPFIEGVSFISYNSTSGEFAFDFNLAYGGGFKLQLVAQLHLRNVALPPVIVTVEIEKLEGNVHMSVGAPPSNKAWIGFHEAPKIHLNIKQEVSTGKQGGLLSQLVKAIPDLSDVITDVVKVKLFEDMILPNMDDIPLPDVKKTPPSSPVTAGGGGGYPKHQTTFGPGGNQGPVAADHAKPAGYPGAAASTTSNPSMASVAAAATAAAAKKDDNVTAAILKKDDTAAQAAQASSSSAASSKTTTPRNSNNATDVESPIKKNTTTSSKTSSDGRRKGGGSEGGGAADGEEMKEFQSTDSLGTVGVNSVDEEREQLDALAKRSQQRSETMKEVSSNLSVSNASSASNSRTGIDVAASSPAVASPKVRSTIAESPAADPKKTTATTAAPAVTQVSGYPSAVSTAATSSAPVGYPSGISPTADTKVNTTATATTPTASPYGASPYGASPYSSTANRGSAVSPAAAAASASNKTTEKKDESAAGGMTKKAEDPKPAGYPGAQQYTYNTQQPQWSSNSQPQWGK